jgi:hypothetical protein
MNTVRIAVSEAGNATDRDELGQSVDAYGCERVAV